MVAIRSCSFAQEMWLDLEKNRVYEVIEWSSYYKGAAFVGEYMQSGSGSGSKQGFAFHQDLGDMPPAPSREDADGRG